jgi:2-methylfumaryl-CoA isomerase
MAVITGNPDGSAAVDYTVNAAMGFPWITGPEGWDGPVNHVLPAWDALTGYLVAAGIVAAELHRVRTGEGQLIKVSLADVALSITGHLGLIAEAQLNDEPRARYGNDLYGSLAHDFETADGRRVIVVALTPRQWTSLVAATGLERATAALAERLGVDLLDEGARFGARREIRDLLAPWISGRTLAEVSAVFDTHEVMWGPYQTFQQLIDEDKRCSSLNSLFAEVEQPGIGRLLRATSPLVFSRASRKPPSAAPTIGADTEQVLRSWLGMTPAEVSGLIKDGVVGRD